MSIPPSVWQQAQYDLLEDFMSFWLPPPSSFAIDVNYPKSESMVALAKDHGGALHIPEKRLLLLDDLFHNYSIKQSEQVFADWATLFQFELLQGIGRNLADDMEGPALEGLNQLATTWGLYLARQMKNSMFRWEVFSTFGIVVFDMLADFFRQLPSKELGDALRASATPAFIRAHETVRYTLALLNGNQRELQESLDILRASDADLQREINHMFHKHSSQEAGRELQQKIVHLASFLRNFFGDKQRAEQFQATLPVVFRIISWSIGYRLRQNMQCNPQKVKALFEAINSHKEIEAALEQYRYKHAWQGDRNKATVLAWQALAPKYFHLSTKIENIDEDEDQERLIGMQQGLEQYVDKNPAIVALVDGLLGRLGAYLRKAAENERRDYIRNQVADGNKVQTEGEHISDLRCADSEEDEELPDEEILSREKEKHRPSRNAVVEELEFEEMVGDWHKLLTEGEKTATNLKSDGYTQLEIARMMGISQQRVAQLLASAWAKYFKIKDSSLSP
jgi:DNA-directed RNA polymerase specialized sigma24 family protein